MNEFVFTDSSAVANCGVRRLAIKQIPLEKSVEHDDMVAYYRNLSAEDRMRDFLALQKAMFVAMGYKKFPQVERIIRLRKMK